MAMEIVTEIEYRELADFPGYRFGSDGSVWSKWVGTYSSDGPRTIKRSAAVSDEWRRRTPSINSLNGYLQTRLKTQVEGKWKYRTFRLHSIILRAFSGPRPFGMQCCHNNGIRHDNRIENLRWDTPAANQADRYKHEKERELCTITSN